MDIEKNVNVIKPDLSFIENDSENRLLDVNNEELLDQSIQKIEDYIKSNNGSGLTEEQKDVLYSDAQNLWREYYNNLNSTRYNFILNKREYKLLVDIILNKIEYDVNTVFFAIELSDLLREMRDNDDFKKDDDLATFKVDATQITYIYHIISKYTVKGLNKNSYTFANILKKIGAISKVFNYYETSSKNLSVDIQDWIVSMSNNPVE